VHGRQRLATSQARRDWLEAARYALALQSSAPLPVVDRAPVRLAPHETATMRTIAIYERMYPGRPFASWGDRHSAAVVGTTDRLVVDHRMHGWMSFWFADLDVLEPALEEQPWCVDLAWRHDEAPLRLSGTTAPLVAVHVAAYTDWGGWTHLPELQTLLTTTAEPEPGCGR
jgi:hypothetical protein